MSHGAHSLSISELLAILIGSGNQEENAVELCRRILSDANNDLIQLSRYTLEDLQKYKGVGPAKAISILAALELGKRRETLHAKKEITIITSSSDAYKIIKDKLMDLDHEEFWCIFLNRGNKILEQKRISSGGFSGTFVDPKIIFRKALEVKSSAIILVHNHPSGTLRPSDADLSLTKKITAAGNSLDIKVLDHLILTSSSYFSMADEGLMNNL